MSALIKTFKIIFIAYKKIESKSPTPKKIKRTFFTREKGGSSLNRDEFVKNSNLTSAVNLFKVTPIFLLDSENRSLNQALFLQIF